LGGRGRGDRPFSGGGESAPGVWAFRPPLCRDRARSGLGRDHPGAGAAGHGNRANTEGDAWMTPETRPHGQSEPHEQPGVRRWMNGALLCNAHNGAGELCGAIAVRGKTKCRNHGGRAVSGVAHPSYKHGRYSKDLSVQMALRAEEARSNPHLLSVSDDMAVLEARLADLMQTVGEGESAQVWKALRKTLTLFSVAEREGDG